MWASRLKLQDEQSGTIEEGAMAFMAVPAMMTGTPAGGAFQQQLYHWAYEQAKQTLEASKPAPVRDLFAVMN
jgi:hypothetical protein